MTDTTTDTSLTDEQHRLLDLMEHFETGMLVTRGGGGELHAVPMRIAELDEHSHRLTFVTGDESRKVEEILTNPMVLVSFQSKTRYLSLSGTAHVERDSQRIRELWHPDMELWFPEGPDDPRIALLVVDPRRGEYWDLSGTRGLRFLLRAGAALIQGDHIREDLDATHAEIPL